MAFKQGQLVKVTGTFETSAGVATDPSAVFVTVVRPDGYRATYQYGVGAQVVKSATGIYYINLDASVPGTWTYWWHSTGNAQAADEKTFIVEAVYSADAPDEPKPLTIDFFEIQRAVGRMLGYGRDPGAFTPQARADVRDCIRSGQRRFYWHPPLTVSKLEGKDGQFQSIKQKPSHAWSFLSNTTTLALVAGTATYDLPEDFGEMIDGAFVFTTDQQSVAIITDQQILQMQSQDARTGPPKYAALRNMEGAPSRYQVVFYPTPAVAHTLTYSYSIAPKDLSEVSPIPLGGPMHAETLLEACLAAAEKTLNDTEEVHEKKFLECLARSIQADEALSHVDEDGPWPMDEVASGLEVNKAYLKRLIGMALGYGPHQATWNHKQSSEVALTLETGLRKHYSPMVLPGEKYAHDWSYLTPVGTIVTNDDQYVYDLPPDFVTLEGPLTFAPDEGLPWETLEIVPEYRVRQQLSKSVSTGRPRYAAYRMGPMNPTGGTRYELVFWPPPDGAYPLSFRYRCNPGALAEDATLPYGGQQHAQTLIEACLAAAEEQRGGMNGPHGVKFLECLKASVSIDRRTGAPERMGYNGDSSDRIGTVDAYPWRNFDPGPVEYAGQTWD